MVVRWEEVRLEGLAAVSSKADLGGNPATDQHYMGQQPTERQLRAELLLEVPEVAAGGQRLVHVLAEDVLGDYGRLDIAIRLGTRKLLDDKWQCLVHVLKTAFVTVSM